MEKENEITPDSLVSDAKRLLKAIQAIKDEPEYQSINMSMSKVLGELNAYEIKKITNIKKEKS